MGHFAASFRGGNWTASKRCVGVYCAIGESQTPEAYEWAKRVIGNKMASFSLKKYQEDLAGALACFWADRMELLYSCHKYGRLVGGRLTPELRAEAPQPILARDILVKKDDPNHPGHDRLANIVETDPR